MIGTPLDVLPYVRGIQMVLSRYEGYTKGKRRDADKLIRDEIVRANGLGELSKRLDQHGRRIRKSQGGLRIRFASQAEVGQGLGTEGVRLLVLHERP